MTNKASKKNKAGPKKRAKAASRNPPKRAARKPTKKRTRRGPSDYVVFISHSSKESWIAAQIAKEVRGRGAEAWVDVNDLSGGDDFYEKIMEAIHGCTEAIVLISPISVNSQWVSFEIGAVAGQGKRVTPVLNNVTAGRLEPLRRVSAIELNDFDDYLRQLEARIRQHKRGGRR